MNSLKRTALIVFSSLTLCAGLKATAEAEADYTCRQVGSRYVVSVKNRREIVQTLTAFCKDKRITSGTIVGIGAINRLTLRFFNPATKKYDDRAFNEQMEIANLTGNVSTKDGETYLHLHVTVGCRDYTARAGHLLAATLNGAGEFVVEDFGVTVERTFDPGIGLNFYDFRKGCANDKMK